MQRDFPSDKLTCVIVIYLHHTLRDCTSINIWAQVQCIYSITDIFKEKKTCSENMSRPWIFLVFNTTCTCNIMVGLHSWEGGEPGEGTN